MYLGVQAVLAKSFARIHLSNLINYGILPLVFKDPLEYEKVSLGDELEFSGVRQSLRKGTQIKAYNHSKKEALVFKALVPKEKIPILLAGGLLPYLKKMKAQSQIPPSSPL
jgi:aconitate hydratase